MAARRDNLQPGVNDLATTHPELAAQWHPDLNDCTPSATRSSSVELFWWRCDVGHEWIDSPRVRRDEGLDCPICTFVVARPSINDLATTHPDLAARWVVSEESMEPCDVTQTSGVWVIWRLDCGHQARQMVRAAVQGLRCDEC